MKQVVETFLRIVLLIVVLYTTSFGAFAGGKKKAARKSPAKTHAVAPATTNPVMTTAAPDPNQPQNAVTPDGPKLTPKLKKKHRVAIVPAPPPPGPDNQAPHTMPH